MLARAVMPVVIVLTETITLGIWEHITAAQGLSRKIWRRALKCHSDAV